MKAVCQIIIHYANGSIDFMPFAIYSEARDYCRNNISYSGDRVKRVEIKDIPGNSLFAIWDSTWDRASQHAGLYN